MVSSYSKFWKPMTDRLVALILILATSPIAFFIALFLKLLEPKQPLLFVQRRPGYLGKIFKLYKFRTLDEAGKPSHSFTYLLRKTGADEWPQLLSILKGKMSFVGPRPLLESYLPLYNETQRLRHKVLPGITGWAQVNGRNTQTWEDRFLMDLEYAEKQSFAFDCRILWLTVKQVFSKGNAAEMPVWQGNSSTN